MTNFAINLKQHKRSAADEFLAGWNEDFIMRLNEFYFVLSDEKIVENGGVFYKDEDIELSIRNNVERVLQVNNMKYDQSKGWFESNGVGGWVQDSRLWAGFWQQYKQGLKSILFDAFRLENPSGWTSNDDPLALRDPKAMLMAYWALISVRGGNRPVRDASRKAFIADPSVKMSKQDLEHATLRRPEYSSTTEEETGWYLGSKYADRESLCRHLQQSELEALNEMNPSADFRIKGRKSFGASEALKVLQGAGMRLSSDRSERKRAPAPSTES